MKRCNRPYFTGLPRNHRDHLRNKKENNKNSFKNLKNKTDL